MHRFDPRKIRERRRIAKLAKQARPRAFEDARRVCATSGPDAIASEYAPDIGWAGEVTEEGLRRVAKRFACAAYRREVYAEAFDGAMAGFKDWGRENDG